MFIELCDYRFNRKLKGKCTCSHVFDIEIYVGTYLNQHKDRPKATLYYSGTQFDIKPVDKMLGLRFDKNCHVFKSDMEMF